ncbi:soluble lytic murein transglycosylase [Alcanivorax xiamenensis]|uniref:Soluble lytic murein transglycosylase n=1 Tax=Alcanivorax xiamenensis TaxID=1177156 RepID=A0ABQ6Y466_9GAMM|nr:MULTISPECIES: lytic murein transglycosylase [Alcanivorax]KAF0804004.1 soluble lytic murein transglycosylase [Alcanivorax xiamenensis]
MNRYKDRLFHSTFLFLFAAFVLTGCGDDESSGDAGAATATLPSYGRIPDCGDMATTLGDLVSGLTPADDDDELGRYQHDDRYGVNCTWLTPRTQSDNAFEMVKGGSLAVSITVDPQGSSDEKTLRDLGMVYDDPRVEELGGYVVDMGGKLDPGAQLGMIGPQVVVGRVNVSFAAGGLYLQKVEELKVITNDRVIEAAVALHRSLR